MERLARLFVGIGFVWVALILLWAIAAGVEQPYAWFTWAADGTGYAWMRPTYLTLAFLVVPIGMVVFLYDVFGDPVSRWVKWAMPGAFLVVYAFFLKAAVPDVGGPLFSGIESIVDPLAGRDPAPGPGSTIAWLIRVAIALAVWAGVPGAIGAVVGMMGGSRAGARRR